MTQPKHQATPNPRASCSARLYIVQLPRSDARGSGGVDGEAGTAGGAKGKSLGDYDYGPKRGKESTTGTGAM